MTSPNGINGSGMEAAGKILASARKVRLVAFDVDGVLTDGKVSYTSSGEEIKSFNVRDGHAIRLARRAGLTVAFITGRKSPMVDIRAMDLGVEHVFQGVKDKIVVLDSLLSTLGLDHSQVAYMGDDLVDLPVLLKVGLGCAVADAPLEVRDRAAIVFDSPGGCGAARDLIVFILKAQNMWDSILKRYL
ncbi:3-deoxy-D-manno-octulosonate 8-phosphate phosphatase KdsC [bacterium BMS3Abin14]|nr:3-deoxy-D-manno-octulosonate 8-phosphate phosphatase KdsC [bacterium BMS3Abin14]